MIRIKTVFILSSMITLSVLMLAGCPERRSIADINADPGRYNNKEVAVAGVVKDSYGVTIPGIAGGGIYKIDDGTGSIWVIADKGTVPQKGAQIAVKGRVGSGLSWGGKNYGLGIYETGRRYGSSR